MRIFSYGNLVLFQPLNLYVEDGKMSGSSLSHQIVNMGQSFDFIDFDFEHLIIITNKKSDSRLLVVKWFK